MGVGGGGGAGKAYAASQTTSYSVAYEETQSNRVSGFRDLCILCFQR